MLFSLKVGLVIPFIIWFTIFVQENLSNEHAAANYGPIRALIAETWKPILQLIGYTSGLCIYSKA